MNKICTKCQESQPLDNFNWRSKIKNTIKNICKSCESIFNKNRYVEKREQILKQNEEWKKNNLQAFKNYQDNYNKKRPKF